MQDRGSAAERAASKEEDKTMEVACGASPSVEFSITNHAIAYNYFRGSVFVRETAPDSTESEDVYTEDEVSSAKGGSAACYKVQRHDAYSGEVTHFPARCWTRGICSVSRARGEHRQKLFRLPFI